MYKDLAEFSLKTVQELGAKYADVRYESHESNGFVLKNGVSEVSGFDKISGLGIRYLINNNLGFVSVNVFDKNKIKKLIEKSVRLTKNGGKISDKINLSEEKSGKANYEVKSKIKDINTEEKLKKLKEVDYVIKELPMRYLSLSDNIIEKYFINSEGSKISTKFPRIHFMYLLTIMENNQTLQRYLSYGACSGFEVLKKWNLVKNISDEVKALKNALKNGVKLKPDFYDVVCGPEVTGIAVHESVGHPYEADRIFGREAAQAGESFVTKKMIGTKIGSGVVNVVDDPTLENSYGFYLYDDEGVKARRKVLIENGFIREFLHDRRTAFDMGLKSNASARANHYDKEVLVRMSNTFMLKGKDKEEDIIKETKKGVYLKNFMEWNIDDKRYQQKYVGSEAYLVEHGEITKPVLSPALEITTPKFWSSVDMVGNKIELFAGSCGKGESIQGIPVLMGGPVIRLKNIRMF
ncbi:MAG: TldD/PmbA family protein [Nanoarchaeota archaeon]|nr:TldD/PmbA family protein [Nanoarchaeota archaeon]